MQDSNETAVIESCFNSSWCGGPNFYSGFCLSDTECECYYSFFGPNCTQTAGDVNNAAYLTLVWFFGVAVLSVICALVVFQIGVMMWRMGEWWRWKNWKGSKMKLLCLTTVFCTAFVRIFYFAIDPYTYKGIYSYCAFYAIDYVSTATVALAYLFALYLLFRVNVKARKTKYAFWFWRSFMIWFFIGTALMIIAPCFIAFTCSCDGIVCNSYQGDNVFYSLWMFVQFMNTVLSIGCAVYVIRVLRKFKKRNAVRLVRFTIFIFVSAFVILGYIALSIYFLVAFIETSAAFFAVEYMWLILMELQLGCVLLLFWFNIKLPSLSSSRSRSAHSSNSDPKQPNENSNSNFGAQSANSNAAGTSDLDEGTKTGSSNYSEDADDYGLSKFDENAVPL